MPDDYPFCPEHSGFNARLLHLETENAAQWRRIDEMKKALDKIPARFNAILISIVLVLLGVIANLVKS